MDNIQELDGLLERGEKKTVSDKVMSCNGNTDKMEMLSRWWLDKLAKLRIEFCGRELA